MSSGVFEQVDLEEFGFQAKLPIQLFDNNQSPNFLTKFFNLLVVSTKHKSIIAVYNNKLKIVPSDKLNDLIRKSDLSEEKKECLEFPDSDIKTIKFDDSKYGDITQIWLSGSESTLFVIHNNTDLSHIDLTDLLNSPTSELKSIRSFDSTIFTAIPNPYNDSQIAFILENETCHILNISSSDSSQQILKATALCWLDSKGGFIVAQSEALDLVINRNNNKTTIQLKEKLEPNLKPRNLELIDKDSVLVVCTDSLKPEPENGYQCLALVINLTTLFIEEADDIGSMYDYILRGPSYYSSSLKSWSKDYPDILFTTTSKTTDISTITSTKIIAQLNDSDRASMPLDDDSGEDDTVMGFSVDLLNTEDVLAPCSTLENSGPLPRLVVLSNRGQLILWNIWYTNGIKSDDCKLQPVIEYEMERIKTAASKISNPVLSQAVPNDPAPTNSAKDSPFAFSVPSDLKTGQSSFGQSGFGQSGFGQSGFGQSGFGKSGFGQSSFGQSSFGKSGFGKSGFGNNIQQQNLASNFGSGANTGGFGAFTNQKSPFSSIVNSNTLDSPFATPNTTKSIFDKPSSTFDAPQNSTSLFSSINPHQKDITPAFSFGSGQSSSFTNSSFGKTMVGNVNSVKLENNSNTNFGSTQTSSLSKSDFSMDTDEVTTNKSSISSDKPEGAWPISSGTTSTHFSFSNSSNAVHNDSPFALFKKSSSEPPSDSPFASFNRQSSEPPKSNSLASSNKLPLETRISILSPPDDGSISKIESEGADQEVVLSDPKRSSSLLNENDNTESSINLSTLDSALDEKCTKIEVFDNDDKEDDEDDEYEESTGEEENSIHDSIISSDIKYQEPSVTLASQGDAVNETPKLISQKETVEPTIGLQEKTEIKSLSDDEIEDETKNDSSATPVVPQEIDIEEKHGSPASSSGDNESFEKIDITDSKISTSEEFEKIEPFKSDTPSGEKQSNDKSEDQPKEYVTAYSANKDLKTEFEDQVKPEDPTHVRVVTRSSETDPLYSVAVHTESLLQNKASDAQLKEYKVVAVGIDDEYKDFGVESFEDDEIYLSKFNIPKTVPNLISLGNIDYPEFTGGPIAEEMNKIIVDIDAEFYLISQNLTNIKSFLISHMNKEIKHTIDVSISFPTFWKLDEVDTIANEITETQSGYDGSTNDLDSYLKDSNEILENLSLQFKKLYEFRTQLKLIESKENTKSAIQGRKLSFDQIQVRNELRRSIESLKNLDKELQAKLLLLNSIVQPSELLNNPRKFDVVITNLNLKMRTELDNIKKLQSELSDIKGDSTAIVSSGKADIGLKLDKTSEAVRITSMAYTITTKKTLNQALRDRVLVPSQFNP